MKRTVKTLITKSLELAGKDIDKLICPFIMYQPKVCKKPEKTDERRMKDGKRNKEEHYGKLVKKNIRYFSEKRYYRMSE